MCECKVDTGSDGNLMLIKTFDVLFQYTKITYLNKSIDRK